MENLPSQLLIPIGAVTAALIAGFFSFLNLVISKEQKVSEFRQAWIDKLRDDLCKYVAAIRYLSSANKVWEGAGHPDQLRHFETMRPTVDSASQAYNSIVLRINPEDKNKKMKELNTNFLATLNKVRIHVDQNKYDDARNVAATLADKLQPILKYEWERVKKGEPIYRITRGVAFFIIIVALVSGVGYAYHVYVSMPEHLQASANQLIKPP